MRRYIVYLMVLMFSVSFTAPSLLAVEKKSKNKTAVQKQNKAKKDSKAKKSSKKKPVVKKKAPKKLPSPKYDSFIDRNRNGIDDRRENLKTKTKGKKPTPKKTDKKAAKAKKKKSAKDK